MRKSFQRATGLVLAAALTFSLAAPAGQRKRRRFRV